ncbi:hypothetical protein CAPTEDRAFT_48361, partial [Capitella teleta]
GFCPGDQWQRRGAYCYLAICQLMSRPEAEEYCNQISHDASLASIHGTAENLFVAATTRITDTDCYGAGFWQGLEHRNGGTWKLYHDWHWSDGTTGSYSAWDSGTPTGEYGAECAYVDCPGHLWRATSCDDARNFVCK